MAVEPEISGLPFRKNRCIYAFKMRRTESTAFVTAYLTALRRPMIFPERLIINLNADSSDRLRSSVRHS